MTAEQDQQGRSALAEVIDRRLADIVARWTERVYAELADPAVDSTALKNAIDDYLVRLAAALRQGDPLARTARAAWTEVAREHALTRVRLGFDIDQLPLQVEDAVAVEVPREDGPSAVGRA